MGSVTVLSSLGEGYYRVRIDFDNFRVEQRQAAIQSQLDKMPAILQELEDKKIPLETALRDAKLEMDRYARTATAQELVGNPATMNTLVEKVYKAEVALTMTENEIKRLKLQKISFEKEKAYLEKNCPSSIETNAWCVEYNEDLAGEMESIEVDYLLERDPITNQLRNDTGVWLPGTIKTPANKLQHILAASSFAAWFNLCAAPAMQRHKGLYRIAILSGLDDPANCGTKCNLEFIGRYDVDRFSQKVIGDKPILPNFTTADGSAQQMTYHGAEIRYMDSDAEAFENGDKVIVDLHQGQGVPTVIGFYSNPRKGSPRIAFKDADGRWMQITQRGVVKQLPNQPALVGDFNWGIANAKGDYDCACVWNGRYVRHGGHNYDLGVDVGSAGVIKDLPVAGEFTIKATAKLTNAIITAVVKDGQIKSRTTNAVTGGADVRIRNDSHTTAPNLLVEYSNNVLIDPSGLFAVVASHDSVSIITNPVTTNGVIITLAHLSNANVKNFSDIYVVDLTTYTSTLLSRHRHYGSSWNLPVAGESLQYADRFNNTGGAIVDGSIRYEHGSLCYGVDNRIMMAALTSADVDFRLGAVYTYSLVDFKNRVINKRQTLYTNKQPMQSGKPGFLSNTNGLLCSVVNNNSVAPVVINNHHSTETPGIDDLVYPGGTIVLGSAGGIPVEAYSDVEVAATRVRAAGDFSGATVRGFSAGCAKIKSRHTGVTQWLEYRGNDFQIADRPSTNYTILI